MLLVYKINVIENDTGNLIPMIFCKALSLDGFFIIEHGADEHLPCLEAKNTWVNETLKH
jgi:hypothetical protein